MKDTKKHQGIVIHDGIKFKKDSHYVARLAIPGDTELDGSPLYGSAILRADECKTKDKNRVACIPLLYSSPAMAYGPWRWNREMERYECSIFLVQGSAVYRATREGNPSPEIIQRERRWMRERRNQCSV